MLRHGFKVIMSGAVDAFLGSLHEDVRAKIIYNVDKVANGYMDKDLFKKLENTDIWEFRTLFKGIQYRLLAFWDTEAETLVVATHGFIKKTQKTPRKEISKAEAIRKLYFETKK
ncbi:MAG: type II toxin-antitoxin system RelE/ParE family toxin [Bacteroidales bacterium]|nr:type II toxin-antitoxin system RelE/ParE family toxin [Bacteroidales bacterium]